MTETTTDDVRRHALYGDPVDPLPNYRRLRRKLATEITFLVDVQEAIGAGECDDVEPYAAMIGWTYRGPDSRTEAADWLRRHARVMRRVARKNFPDLHPVVRKEMDDYHYTVRLTIDLPDGGWLFMRAQVSRNVVCYQEPTGETEVVPATDAYERAVTRRVCPPSLLDGVLDDVTDVEWNPGEEPF